ncbi:MAG: ABC transporter permease [Thermoproteota archaeon]
MGLLEYAARRGLQTVAAFFVLATVGFFLFRVMPGDPTAVLLLNPRIPPETRQLLREQLGLDKPLHLQYLYFIKNFFYGEFGYSFHYGRPVVDIIFSRKMLNTLALVGTSVVLAIAIGVLMAMAAARRRGTRADFAMLVFSLTTYSMPVFWLGMLMLIALSVKWRVFPLGGTVTATRVHEGLLDYLADYLWHMALPLTALTLIQIGYNFLLMRNVLVDIATEDFVVAARAKGLPEELVMRRHVLRNAMLPLVTMVALQLAGIFTGAVLTETVFSWDGLGLLLYEAVMTRDYPLLQGLFMVIVAAFLLANYISDLLYALLDPRVRLK